MLKCADKLINVIKGIDWDSPSPSNDEASRPSYFPKDVWYGGETVNSQQRVLTNVKARRERVNFKVVPPESEGPCTSITD